MPAVGFVADAHAPTGCGGSDRPRRRRVGRPSRCSTSPHVERCITERTKAVIVDPHVRLPGSTSTALRALLRRRGIALIEDCLRGRGGTFADGRPVGTGRLAGCFSFFAKTQLAGRRGRDRRDRRRSGGRSGSGSLRSHAMTSVTWDRHRGHAETYDVTDSASTTGSTSRGRRWRGAHLGRSTRSSSGSGARSAGYRERLERRRGSRGPVHDEAMTTLRAFRLPGPRSPTARRATGSARECSSGGSRPRSTRRSRSSRRTTRCRAAANPCPRSRGVRSRHLALPLSSVMPSTRSTSPATSWRPCSTLDRRDLDAPRGALLQYSVRCRR